MVVLWPIWIQSHKCWMGSLFYGFLQFVFHNGLAVAWGKQCVCAWYWQRANIPEDLCERVNHGCTIDTIAYYNLNYRRVDYNTCSSFTSAIKDHKDFWPYKYFIAITGCKYDQYHNRKNVETAPEIVFINTNDMSSFPGVGFCQVFLSVTPEYCINLNR